jgi:hypothetical protein
VRDQGAAERIKVADRFDRYARHVELLSIPIALIAFVDLLTEWFTGDRRLSIGLLVAVAGMLWSAHLLRQSVAGPSALRMWWPHSCSPSGMAAATHHALDLTVGDAPVWSSRVCPPPKRGEFDE